MVLATYTWSPALCREGCCVPSPSSFRPTFVKSVKPSLIVRMFLSYHEGEQENRIDVEWLGYLEYACLVCIHISWGYKEEPAILGCWMEKSDRGGIRKLVKGVLTRRADDRPNTTLDCTMRDQTQFLAVCLGPLS